MENNWLDIQHRGFLAYLKETDHTDACKKLNHKLTHADKTEEKVNTVFLDCDVKTDWIEQIEGALPFLEKAIQESRQFILRQGETVPVEKAKRVSKESVEHLSRHVELITRIPEPEADLIPDKLYVTENVGTYSVYENRFLYMLLCYIRDFVGFRYKRIVELAASFSTDILINKEFSNETRTIRYALTYTETSKGMEGLCDRKTEEAISRILNILQTADLLLRSELMKDVSTSPMLKPPITRTNVLLHNPNFKAAFELYVFLAAYTEDGFGAVERHRNTEGFSDQMRVDFAALMAETSYLAYRNGGLHETLEKRFLAEEKRRKEEAAQKQKAKLAALKERIGRIDEAAFEYICALEQGYASLEEKIDTLADIEKQCVEAENKLDAAAAQIEQLQARMHSQELALGERIEENQRLSRQHALEMQNAQASVEQVKAQKAEAERLHDAEMEQQKQGFLKEYGTLLEKYRLLNARTRAAAVLEGNQTTAEPFEGKEVFAELEAEYEAFRRYFNRQWGLAKKQIRKEGLWHRKKNRR